MKTILIAEDDSSTLELIVAVLQPLGHNIVTATNGQEAIRQAEQVRPDLLVLDIIMPQGHGFVVCKELRGRSEFDRMKILVLTSKAYAADERQAMELGADAFMNKPFAIKDLQNEVTTLLSQERGE